MHWITVGAFLDIIIKALSKVLYLNEGTTNQTIKITSNANVSSVWNNKTNDHNIEDSVVWPSLLAGLQYHSKLNCKLPIMSFFMHKCQLHSCSIWSNSCRVWCWQLTFEWYCTHTYIIHYYYIRFRGIMSRSKSMINVILPVMISFLL